MPSIYALDRKAKLADAIENKLDEVEVDAIIMMILSMSRGYSNEDAFAAFNEVLVENGREPLLYPTPLPAYNDSGIVAAQN